MLIACEYEDQGFAAAMEGEGEVVIQLSSDQDIALKFGSKMEKAEWLSYLRRVFKHMSACQSVKAALSGTPEAWDRVGTPSEGPRGILGRLFGGNDGKKLSYLYAHKYAER